MRIDIILYSFDRPDEARTIKTALGDKDLRLVHSDEGVLLVLNTKIFSPEVESHTRAISRLTGGDPAETYRPAAPPGAP